MKLGCMDAHSNQCVPVDHKRSAPCGPSLTPPHRATKKPAHNQFQLDKKVLRRLLEDQIGVTGTCPMAALNGVWNGPSDTFSFEIVRVLYEDDDAGQDHGQDHDHYVVTAMCDDGLELRCTPSLLLRSDVHVAWRPASDEFLSCAEERKLLCSNAYKRAQEITTALIAAAELEGKPGVKQRTSPNAVVTRGVDTPSCVSGFKRKRDGDDTVVDNVGDPKQQWDTPILSAEANKANKANKVIVTLDGRGSNRRAMRSVFASKGDPCPRIITFECDPVPALCQRILYGKDVVYTPGDPRVRSRRFNKAGNKSKKKPLIEDVILQDQFGDMLGVDPDDVQLLYLDYCGGPPAGIDMVKVVSKFRNLLAYAGTVSTRRHPSLEETFQDHIPLLFGFKVEREYVSNKRVRCHVHVRTEKPRSVSVPGWFWRDCPKYLKWKRFKGVMVTETTASVQTERGQEIITLNTKARKQFATTG
tara:strand:+ start:6609 stop:8024 length:1416 start_codon:yes stop_codon:yes gene_type:complete